ncbi:hypothetical protein [Larkinella terrae]|uniref:hypothetical protein n=1 Tax=Larkinella terrae TaxID=2025311 RepID=UPI001E5955D3|nr:hypothetical protein [Larkinella terrae]
MVGAISFIEFWQAVKNAAAETVVNPNARRNIRRSTDGIAGTLGPFFGVEVLVNSSIRKLNLLIGCIKGSSLQDTHTNESDEFLDFRNFKLFFIWSVIEGTGQNRGVNEKIRTMTYPDFNYSRWRLQTQESLAAACA